MNKTEITQNALRRMSSEAQHLLTQAEAYELFSLCLIEISDQIAQGNQVTLKGFGKFLPYLTKESQRASPRNKGEMVSVDKKYVPKFRPAPKFREKVISAIPVN
jgi:nucleoid DNA-binding protein